MAANPSIRSAVVTATKFSYYELVSIVLLSVAFWIASAFVVTIGGALIALFETIGSIPETNESARDRLRSFARSVRDNFIVGLPLSALFLSTGVVTLLYFWIGLQHQEPSFVLGGLLGVYALLAALFLSLRIAHLMAVESSSFSTAAVAGVTTAGRNYSFTTVHVCFLVVLLVVVVPLPLALFLLLPGYFAVLEALMHEEIVQPDRSDYRTYLRTRR